MALSLRFAAALSATAVQSFGSLLIAPGVSVLSVSAIVLASFLGAIAQNLRAADSPQLALVYALAFALCERRTSVPGTR